MTATVGTYLSDTSDILLAIYSGEAVVILPWMLRCYKAIPLDHASYIEEVYFGVSCPEDKKQEVLSSLKEQPGIKFYQMTKDYYDIYNLTAKPLADI